MNGMLWVNRRSLAMTIVAVSTAVLAVAAVRIDARMDAIERQLGPSQQETRRRLSGIEEEIAPGKGLNARVERIERQLRGDEGAVLRLGQ